MHLGTSLPLLEIEQLVYLQVEQPFEDIDNERLFCTNFYLDLSLNQDAWEGCPVCTGVQVARTRTLSEANNAGPSLCDYVDYKFCGFPCGKGFILFLPYFF